MNLPDEIDEILENIVKFGTCIISLNEEKSKAKQAILTLKKKWETEAYKKGYIQAGIDNLTNGDKR